MLSSILAQIAEWLLAKLGAFLAAWGKRKIAVLEEKKAEDAAIKELQNAKTLPEKEKAEGDLLNG